MEETRALLESWVAKYINQEVNFRTGKELPSVYLNELFNLLIAQGNDTVEVLSNVREYLLMYADQSQEQSELLDTITLALETVQTALAQAQDTATTALTNTATIPQLVIDVSNALDTANQAIALANTIIIEGVINDNTTSINFTWSSDKINTMLNDHDARLNTLTNRVANNLVTTEAGLVLDARQGKVLDEKINSVIDNTYTKTDVNDLVANISSGLVNVKQFGAIGDGITDDTLALQAAIDFCIENGQALYLTKGTYLFTDRLIITQPLRITGTSVKTSILKFKWDGDAPETSFDDTDWYIESDCAILIKSHHVTLEHFSLIGGDSKAEASIFNGIGLHWAEWNDNLGRTVYGGTERTILNNIDIRCFRNGVFNYGGWNRYIYCCHFVDNTDSGIKYYPLELDTVGNWSGSGDVIIACQFIGNQYGYYARANFESVVWNAVFEYNEHAIYTYGCKDVVFKNCWNEANIGKIIIHGSVRFEGGYNIQKDTVDHFLIDGEGIVSFEYETSNIIMKEGNVVFNQQNGIITKGVELGAIIENLFANPYFKEASGGTDSIPSKANWECYVDYLFTVDETVQYEGNNSMRMVVEGREDLPEFNFNQSINVQTGNSYNISIMVRTPDRMQLHNSEIFIRVAYRVDSTVVGWLATSHTIVGNNAWEEKTITVPEISESSNINSIRIYFGTAQNGTVYFANPIVSVNDSAVKSNIILRKGTGDVINIIDYSGVKIGEIPYTQTSM